MILCPEGLVLKRRRDIRQSPTCFGKFDFEILMETEPMAKSDLGASSRWRWLLWTAFVIVWTAALLTTEPVQVAQAMLAPRTIYPTAKLLHVSAYAFLAVLSGWLFVPARWRW